MHYSELIETKYDVMLGKPVLKDSRITVESILRKLSEGMSFQDIIDSYPTLTMEKVKAALEYSADMIKMEEAASA